MNKTKERYCSPTITSFVVVEVEQDLLTGTINDNGTESGNKVTPGDSDGWGGDGWGN